MKFWERIRDTITGEEWEGVYSYYLKMKSDIHMGICSGSYDKEGLLNEIRNKTEVGVSLVQMHIGFLEYMENHNLKNNKNIK